MRFANPGSPGIHLPATEVPLCPGLRRHRLACCLLAVLLLHVLEAIGDTRMDAATIGCADRDQDLVRSRRIGDLEGRGDEMRAFWISQNKATFDGWVKSGRDAV